MDKNKLVEDKPVPKTSPPFFEKWSSLYAFILIFELVLILLFILITNSFQA